MEAILPNGTTAGQSSTPRSSFTTKRHAAIYCRVSSEEQCDNQTIQTQIATAKQWLDLQKMMYNAIEVSDLSCSSPGGYRDLGPAALQAEGDVHLGGTAGTDRNPRP
jgi:hypothetical protein